eukprot:m.221067 g.221067  ORF g.221067 m.221067 type:complete len:288 (+) comp10508_c0_seq1:102-965(+)
MSAYTVEERGAANTLDYKVYFKGPDGKYVSPFHDIPTYASEDKSIVNMVVEVPRWTNAKLEISKADALNPIVQDEKKGVPRFVHNCFPHHGYIWNYGAVPQTWENPSTIDKHTNAKGDNDPVDICDISEKIATVGQVKQVKILGVMAMIDEGETDYKLIGIDVTDPLASQLNDIDDVDRFLPGYLAATNEWFRVYKIPAGKPENTFAFNGEAKSKDFALQILGELHEQWVALQSGEAPAKLSTVNTTLENKNKISGDEAASIVAKAAPHAAPAPVDPSIHKWHYIKL